MCSISWQTHSAGYDLFFNRDEQRRRPAAEAPQVFHSADGTSFLAPIDPQGGGTWIFHNSHGLTGALLNAYEIDHPPACEPVASRGQLLRSAAPAGDLAAFRNRIGDSLQRAHYPPCYFFAIDGRRATGLWRWNGKAVDALEMPPLQFFTTSSVHPAAVRARREADFRRCLGSPPHRTEALEAFHLGEDRVPSAHEVRMARADARTVSYTRVRLRDGRGTMRYAPCGEDLKFSVPTEATLP